MPRAQVARLVAATAFAVTLACAWLLLPDRVEVVLGETDVTLDLWQYVVAAGILGWAMAVGAGGVGLGYGALASTFRTGRVEPGDLPAWIEAWVLVCACAYVWLQVADPPSLEWWQLAVVVAGAAGGATMVLAQLWSLRGPDRD